MTSKIICLHGKEAPAQIDISEDGQTQRVQYEQFCEICSAYRKGWDDSQRWASLNEWTGQPLD